MKPVSQIPRLCPIFSDLVSIDIRDESVLTIEDRESLLANLLRGLTQRRRSEVGDSAAAEDVALGQVSIVRTFVFGSLDAILLSNRHRHLIGTVTEFGRELGEVEAGFARLNGGSARGWLAGVWRAIAKEETYASRSPLQNSA